MNVRVTSQTQVARAIADLRARSAAVAGYQDQIASGVRLRRPSDDPAAFAAAARQKAAGQRLDGYLQTVSDATADLNEGVSALQSGNQILTRARQIAQEGANAATDAAGRAALATEVDSLLDRMLAVGNGRADGRYVFGGTATGTAPFAVAARDAEGQPTAITYQGSPDRARGLIGPTQTVDTRYAGGDVFQQPGADVFAELIGLRDELRGAADPGTALSQRLAGLEQAQDAVTGAIGEQSGSLASLEAVQARAKDLRLAAVSRASELEGTDYAEAVVKLNEEQSVLQAALATSARLLEPILLDFIR